MPEHIDPHQRQIRFYVVSVEDMQRLHDAFQGINRIASCARMMMKASLADQSGAFRQDLSDALVDIVRLSELDRREIHALLTHGPITMTTTATTEA